MDQPFCTINKYAQKPSNNKNYCNDVQDASHKMSLFGYEFECLTLLEKNSASDSQLNRKKLQVAHP